MLEKRSVVNENHGLSFDRLESFPNSGKTWSSKRLEMKNDPLIEMLRQEFERKKARNKAYSLRSYARDLRLDPSNLCKILKNQIQVGARLRAKLGKKLGFEEKEIEQILKPISDSKTADADYQSHELEIFQVIAEWQHYAILEYVKLTNASHEPSVIGQKLGLKSDVAEESIRRLLDLGLLKSSEGRLLPAEESSSSILNVPTSKAHREQQTQILERAIDALHCVEVQRRSQSSMTLAVDSSKLGEAIELIKRFRRDLGRLLSTSKNLDHVYQLSISLYPLTQPQREGNSL